MADSREVPCATCPSRDALTPATSDGWTPELRRLEREYDEARHAAHAAQDGFEEGLIRAAQEAWERFSTAVQNGR